MIVLYLIPIIVGIWVGSDANKRGMNGVVIKLHKLWK